jgi:hypothetical protein
MTVHLFHAARTQLMFTVAPLIVMTREMGSVTTPPRRFFALVKSRRGAAFAAPCFGARDAFSSRP